MKTKVIGLTGGIGSGKSTVAKFFAEQGIPVYIADDAAKEVMRQPAVVAQIAGEFIGVVRDGEIDRSKLADMVFNNPQRLEILNKIVHPAVRQHFKEWLLLQDSPFVIREAAILFESGSYADCDLIITVTAPVETRIQRVILRDAVSREQVLQRINNQWTDEMRIAKSDYVIYNINRNETALQVQQILKKIENH